MAWFDLDLPNNWQLIVYVIQRLNYKGCQWIKPLLLPVDLKVSKNVAAACVGAKNLHTTRPWLQKTGLKTCICLLGFDCFKTHFYNLKFYF